MADKVDAQVTDALTISNVKNIAEAASNAMAMLYQEKVSHHKSMDLLREGFMSTALERFSTTDPKESVGIQGLIRGGANADIGSLASQIALAQIQMKGAQSTPGDPSGELGKIMGVLIGMQSQQAALAAQVAALSGK